MLDDCTTLDRHCAHGLQQRLDSALARAGLQGDRLDGTVLSPIDQVHVRGLTATKALAVSLDLKASMKVLDVGSGLGGPARYLAEAYGCEVIGIDACSPFVAVANTLARLTGQATAVSFLHADALAMPFAAESFDAAWSQHVAMSVADRERFYGAIHRVLKRGARFATYDVVAGNGAPLIYPVPWARGPEKNFLQSIGATRDALKRAGFTEESWDDKTEFGLAWYSQQRRLEQSGSPPGVLDARSVLGPEYPQMIENLGRNLAAGRVRLMQAVVSRR